MDRNTGRALDSASDEHFNQSVGDILTTPLAARSMLRAYGSELFDLIDQPNTPLNRMRIFAATALALLAWERRGRLKHVDLLRGADGAATLRLSIVRTDRVGRPTVDLAIPLRPA